MNLLNPIGNYLIQPPQFTYTGQFYGLTIASKNTGYITFPDSNNATYPLAAMDRYYIKGTIFTITFIPDLIAQNGSIYDNIEQFTGKRELPFIFPFYIALAQSANDPLPSQNSLLNSYLRTAVMSFSYTNNLTQASNITFSSLNMNPNYISVFSQRMKTLAYQITTNDVNALTLTVTGYYLFSFLKGRI